MKLEVPSLHGYPSVEAEWVAFLTVQLAVILVLVWHGWFRPRRRRWPARGSRLAALLIAVAFFATLEAVLRLHEYWRPSTGYRLLPNLIWTLAPNMRNQVLTNGGDRTVVSTNELGLRETEVDYKKAPGEFRILCMGDSRTFGQGIPIDETFPKRLQKMLRSASPERTISVVNAGLQGFSCFQGYHLLRQLMPIYRPDLVILCGFNEYGNAQMGDMEAAMPEENPFPGLHRSLVYLLVRKEIYKLVPLLRTRDAAETADVSARPGGRYQRFMSFDTMLRWTRAMVECARVGGAKIVIFEEVFSVEPRSPAIVYRPSHHPVLEFLPSASDLTCVALLPVRTMEERHEYMLGDHIHPNSRGNEAIAKALFQLIQDKQLILP